jgi:hypothetical protein
MEKDPSAANDFLRRADKAERHSHLVLEAVAEHEQLNTERIEEAAEP